MIDTGRVKETQYDAPNDITRLVETWASRAACKQRKGRAGRVQVGKCYKMYTRQTEQERMAERQVPEMRRTPLESVCLGVLAMGVRDVRAFLDSAVTPPEEVAVDAALAVLERVGAYTRLNADGEEDRSGGWGKLTTLGKYMSLIPASLPASKLLIYGVLFDLLEPALTLAALMSSKSPFVDPMDKREESKAIRMKFSLAALGPGSAGSGYCQGDILSQYAAYTSWSHSMHTARLPQREIKFWCEENFLSHHTLLDIVSTRAQLLSSLKEAGLVDVAYSSPNPVAYGVGNANPADLQWFLHPSESHTLRTHLLAPALAPMNIARIVMPKQKYHESAAGAIATDNEARELKYYASSPDGGGRVFIHPSSTLFSSQTYGVPWVCFGTKVGGGAAFRANLSNNPAEGDSSGSSAVALKPGQIPPKTFIRDVTPLSIYSLLLLTPPTTGSYGDSGGHLAFALDTLGRGIILDNGTLRVRTWGRIGVLIGCLRRLVGGVLGEKMMLEGKLDGGSEEEELRRREIIGVVKWVLVGDGHH